jgi:shikimate dehydrogenase
VTGFNELSERTVAALNAALAHLGLPARCLPLGVGSLRLFRQIMDAVKVAGVVVDAEHAAALLGMATELESAARQAGAVDLLLHKGEHWHGYNTTTQAALAALETALQSRHPGEQPVKGRQVLIVGANPLARAMACGIKERGGAPIIASHDKEAAHRIAIVAECRYIQFEALYSTMHDVLLICDHEKQQARGKSPSGAGGVHVSVLKPQVTLMDLTVGLGNSELLERARLLDCTLVAPRQLLLEQLLLQLRLLTGKEVPPEVLLRVLDEEV